MSDAPPELHANPSSGELTPGETVGTDDPALILCELKLAAVLEIGAWPNRLEAVTDALSTLSRADPPGRPGRFSQGDDALLGWLAFGRFLWLSDADEDATRLGEALDTNDAAVVDLGSARRGVRLSGEAAIATLNKEVAIDFDLKAFPPGSLAQAVIHQVPVIILRRSEDSFDLLVSSSLADAFLDWLRDAAAEFGYRVGDPLDKTVPAPAA
ncbi:sarcosine oxidase subunit gamma [Stappia sp. ES.058]|uniref:sarcosine oxidase subunit gamma n=1 Tax=Stappia sp. ES.058 TaxID=1881061 RepID=UPI00087AA2C9|nr:sarcosine oxidase subunit gamma family protein [Stappia sp. ES.058]SDU00908.1 sarcosine oxidase, gamma subunit family, heterotetrameric form [Stappia sp. ES.058]